MKFFQSVTIIISVGILMNACRKEEAESIDISFSASKQTAAIGEEITFSMGYGADALSIYTGDTTKQFSKSAVANLGNGDLSQTQYIPSHPYVDSFRVDASSTIPSTISVKGTATISPSTGKGFEFTSTSTNGRDTLSIKPDKGGFYGTGLTNVFNQAPDRNVTIVGYFPGSLPATTTIAIRARLQIKNIWSATVVTQNITLPANRDSAFSIVVNMASAITAWESANGGVANVGAVTGIDLIVGLVNGTVPAYQGKFNIQTIRFSEKGFLPWDVGAPVQYLNYKQPATYKYSYSKAGQYIVTMVATSVGRKKFAASGYIETRLPIASEYDLKRQIKQITVTVQ